ncbi:hypothetical protein FK85_26455 [Halorubrum saccharovorum]|uniref:Uncharacterized protein n=1 Tax=Halorubrum saccharovorum TaxID=2248 RepID=A0A0F8AY90_9EURY|nr:hypothetical protein FK85_26455 [Halorubrum saccharovorum]
MNVTASRSFRLCDDAAETRPFPSPRKNSETDELGNRSTGDRRARLLQALEDELLDVVAELVDRDLL